ncbi:hypothetical protein [Synechococcus sp. RSCCF101]|uniref:hypothetical protein n=1 Tax=Synechococcus sp. RSCCF101 TaxID=2511069 RepID=UPI00177F72C2|nr:hypothetical protein [Synechococcus sp. RSCCF101]
MLSASLTRWRCTGRRRTGPGLWSPGPDPGKEVIEVVNRFTGHEAQDVGGSDQRCQLF